MWDYKLRRCLFTLIGHLDYIRTVEFHPRDPWIVSASDDQTIRIWDWRQRACVSVLTGHNHYVMCARFHPTQHLVVSASLDQTVRVWDTSGLRRKSSGRSREPRDSLSARVNADFFGGNDAVVKYVLEGHERGVNWASFHPKMPLIVSGADDRLVKMWRMNETKAWEVDTMRGHNNNVSCCMFVPKTELVISNSEDRTIRVWDVSKQMGVQTFRREHDRFWILATHPGGSLLAAGHDSGMMVFKLSRERPAYAASSGQVFYVKSGYLRRHVLGSVTDVPVVGLRRSARQSVGYGPRTLVLNPYNNTEDNLLLHSTAEGGLYYLFCLNQVQNDHEPMKGRGVAAAVFLRRNRFITLDSKFQELVVRSLSNEIRKRMRSPLPRCDMLFTARTAARVLLRNDEKVALFEPDSRRVLGEVFAARVKYVVWNQDGSMVALLSKTAVTICSRDLELLCSVQESVRVKSGVWDAEGVFVYTTHTHIKYVLPIKSADVGIVRTLPDVVYAVEASGDTLHCLNRSAKPIALSIDRTEYLFKLALAKQKWDVVMRTVRSGRLCGQAVIGYLQNMGYPEVALHFVEDEATRFNLALEYGNLDVALKAAKAVNSKELWQKLAQAALRQGNHQVVEMAYQQTEDFERLSFLYLITGNVEKLRLMLKIAGIRKNLMAEFHNALYLGDVATRVRLLADAGQLALAYVAAATHGLTEQAVGFAQQLEEAGVPVPPLPQDAAYLIPPTPLMRLGCGDDATGAAEGGEEDEGANWPLLQVQASVFDQTVSNMDRAGAGGAGAGAGAVDVHNTDDGADIGEADLDAWGDAGLDLGLGGAPAGGAGGAGAGGDDEAGGWGADEDLDLPDLGVPAGPANGGGAAGGGAADGGRVWRPPSGGTSPREYWVHNSTVPGDHVAAGSFETAMTLLNRQIGVRNYEPLRAAFMRVYTGATLSLPTLPGLPSQSVFLARNGAAGPPPGADTLPRVCVTVDSLLDLLKGVFRSFQGGKFQASKAQVDELLHTIPLVSVSSRSEELKVKEVLGLAMEYAVAVKLELARRASTANPKRALELVAYTTHCNLKPAHLMLALNLAMIVSYKGGNFIHAAGFAQRLLEMPETMSAKNEKMASRVCATQLWVGCSMPWCKSSRLCVWRLPGSPSVAGVREAGP